MPQDGLRNHFFKSFLKALRSPSGFKTVLQIKEADPSCVRHCQPAAFDLSKVMALAQTKVQTKACDFGH